MIGFEELEDIAYQLEDIFRQILLFFIIIDVICLVIIKSSTIYSLLISARKIYLFTFKAVYIFILSPRFLILLLLLPDSDNLSIISLWSMLFRDVLILSMLTYITPLVWIYYNRIIDFYSSSHVKNLQYFILYLRGFDDDEKNRHLEKCLFVMLGNFFPPYAVGRPNEISSSGALKIYLKEDWQVHVLAMMERAPIILLRTSNSPNFEYELDHCVTRNYLYKSIFWITDIKQYVIFAEKMKNVYNLTFPHQQLVTNNCLIYQDKEGQFKIHILDSVDSYKNFVISYGDLRGIFYDHYDYFYGRNIPQLKQLFSWKKDSDIMPGIQKWSWIAFIFPTLFVIFNPIKKRVFLYILLLLLSFICFPIRFLIMIFMGRNGRRLLWLNHKWESVEYFEKSYRDKCIKIALYGGVIITFIMIYMFLIIRSLL